MIYPLGEPAKKISVYKTVLDFHVFVLAACVRVHVCDLIGMMMLTYLVANFVGFLHQHSPLIIQLHGHAATTVGVFPHPAEELLQLPAQGGVGVSAGF